MAAGETRSFDVRYDLQTDGSFNVREDLAVDFDALERHGIFRDMPVEYKYDDNSNRLIDVSDVSVTDGSAAIPFETSDTRPNVRIKVGDTVKLVSSRQRYVISYTVHDGLNPFPDHDELFWNVTGNDWPVAVEALRQPWWRPSLESSVSLLSGPAGSTTPCATSLDATSPSFLAAAPREPGGRLTIGVEVRRRH